MSNQVKEGELIWVREYIPCKNYDYDYGAWVGLMTPHKTGFFPDMNLKKSVGDVNWGSCGVSVVYSGSGFGQDFI